jgi:hypothetical protein
MEVSEKNKKYESKAGGDIKIVHLKIVEFHPVANPY